MELTPGYKQTEVGVIPKDWKVQTIAGLCRQIIDYRGRTPKKLGLTWGGGNIPALSAGNVKMGYIDFAEECYLGSEKLYNKWMTQGKIEKNDVLFTTEAPLGNVALVPDEQRYILSQRVVLFKINKEEATSRFVFQLLSSEAFQRTLAEYASGSTAKGIQRKKLEQLRLPRPLPSEQTVIGEALSDGDALLDALDRLIAKKRDLKQAAMQQLLTGQTRLPGFSDEWTLHRLGEIGEITSAGVDKKVRPDEPPVRLVNYLDVYHRTFLYGKDLNHWVTAPLSQANRCAVQKGDVFFTPSSETRDDIGISSVAMEDIPDAAYSYHVVRFRLREPWDLRFRAYAFKTRAFFDQAETLCDGNGTRYVISQAKFRSIRVRVPSIAEQSAIADVLFSMDAELAALEQRREKTRAIKQGMMQELLTGKTRLV